MRARTIAEVHWTPRHWEFGVGVAWGSPNVFGVRRRTAFLMLGPVCLEVGREAVR